MKVLGWIIMLPVVLFALLVAARVVLCGPNSADVKVMKPMAEKISEYIVKNGIPKSLKDIPGLPYELECGKYKEEYFIYDHIGRSIKSNKENAISMAISEDCIFSHHNRSYYLSTNVEFYFKKYGNRKAYANIRIGNKKSKTWNLSNYSIDWNNKIIFDDEIKFSSSKTSGICNPMRQ